MASVNYGLWLVLLFTSFCSCQFFTKSPNIVFILTDDQDVELGGMSPMQKAKKLIGDEGITFKNMFVTSPLCCPSRSSILTGNYVHNNGAVNNSLSGNCSSPEWQQTAEKKAFPTYLKLQKYKTFFAGKYLNQYGFKAAGGVEHVPPGWDDWHALVGNSVYYNYTLSVNGKAESHGDKYPDDYLTEVIHQRALSFLDSHTIFSDPFFMMLSTPACHAPFTPAPKYNDSFHNVSAPRDGSFNKYNKDTHWLVRSVKHPLGPETMKLIDPTFRNRWRTLLSVDDMIEDVVSKLKDKKLLDNTYIFYSSDNGYHLGQLSLPYDKRQLYEFDIRVPLMVRGPGIAAGQIRTEPVLSIDLAPTFVELSGKTPPSIMDGMSLKKLLDAKTNQTMNWRTDFMVEHSGEVQKEIKGCPHLSNQLVSHCYPDCVCEDSYNNTYACVRVISKAENMIYCQFTDKEDFVEMYDLSKDPHQLSNLAKTADPKELMRMNKRLVKLAICKGPTCRMVDPYPPGHNYYSQNDYLQQSPEGADLKQADDILKFKIGHVNKIDQSQAEQNDIRQGRTL